MSSIFLIYLFLLQHIRICLLKAKKSERLNMSSETFHQERISTDSSFRFATFGMTGILKDEGKREAAAKPPLPASVPHEARRRSERNEV